MTKWEVKRGDVIFCDLGIRTGSVQSGIRPCIVVSNDYGNTYSSTYIVVPLTTKHKPILPTHVEIEENSYALCEQVTTVSEQQILRKKNYSVDMKIMKKINNALRISMGLNVWEGERNEKVYNER